MVVLGRRKHPAMETDPSVSARLDAVAARLERVTEALEHKLDEMREERAETSE